MRKRLNADTINVNGKTVNVGIDVHKVSWHVTALVEGIVVESATIKPSYRVLKKLLAQYKGARIRIAYEAGFSGFNLYDELNADGMECIVVCAFPAFTDKYSWRAYDLFLTINIATFTKKVYTPPRIKTTVTFVL